MEKIRELYVQQGFYMADVTYELKRVNQSEVDVYFRVSENAKVEVRQVNFVGNKAVTDEELRGVMLTQEADLLSFVTSSGTYREDVFQRDLLLLQAYYQDRGYINVKVARPASSSCRPTSARSTSRSRSTRGRYTLGKIDFKGDLLEDKAQGAVRGCAVKTGETFNRSKLGQDIQKLTESTRTRATPTSTSSRRPTSTRRRGSST